jgi:hypothetical protein
MGTTIGKSDKNATNDVLNGDVVATGTPGAKTVADPNRGLDISQIRNRKLLSGGLSTIGAVANPITSPMDNPGAGTNFTFANNQPQVTPPIQDPYNSVAPKNRNPFFGRGY